jgi:hypothetical protein
VSVRSSKSSVLLVVALVAAACLSFTAGAGAVKPPKVGTWKVIAAENTSSGGIKVTGGTIGSFRVTADQTVVGFHLRFTETSESAGCAGGEGFESKPEGKSGVLKFLPSTTVSVFKSGSQWLAAAGTGGAGGLRVQPAEVAMTVPFGQTETGSLYIALATTGKAPRGGGLLWRSGSCAVTFVVKPG